MATCSNDRRGRAGEVNFQSELDAVDAAIMIGGIYAEIT